MEQENQPKQVPSQDQPASEQISGMAIICYIGFLCLIPYLTQEKDEAVKFHAKQGLILFFFEAATWVFIAPLPFFMLTLFPLLQLFWLGLSLMGIYNAVKGRKNKLPLIGNLADRIKF